MEKFRFQNFKVYQDALDFRIKVKPLLDLLDIKKDYSLKSQLHRATNSIILNIAEGSARISDKDFKRFLGMSYGSVSEVVSCLDICLKEKLITKNEYSIYFQLCDNLAGQLGGFMKKLRRHKLIPRSLSSHVP